MRVAHLLWEPLSGVGGRPRSFWHSLGMRCALYTVTGLSSALSGGLAVRCPTQHLERMAQERTRRLAAVWFADIVGYTELSSRDEDGALAVVDELQTLAREEVESRGGGSVQVARSDSGPLTVPRHVGGHHSGRLPGVAGIEAHSGRSAPP